MPSIFPLKGVIQPYAWGGFDFINDLLNEEKRTNIPAAELWLGTHPKGVSLVKVDGEWRSLRDFIANNPTEVLGKKSVMDFGESLPFLFKILDVRKMLSIQVHPNKKAAAVGFEKENKSGIPLDAFHRNFRDANHKPELMWALTDFWLLHGFKNKTEIAEMLAKIPEFQPLQAIFAENESISILYQYIMQLPQEAINNLLSPLHIRLIEMNKKGCLTKGNPDFWAHQACQDFTQEGSYDRGVFAVYFLNLVFLKKGESIFQDSGTLHAYLEGVNIELMANSDNVLRGGLTPKHVDVEALMKHVNFAAVMPRIIQPTSLDNLVYTIKSPAPDFELCVLKMKGQQKYKHTQSQGAEIYLVLNGEMQSEGHVFKKGEAFFVPNNTVFEMTGKGNVFRAGLPEN